MRRSFADKLGAAQRESGGSLALVMSPRLNQMPLPMQRFDDPFLPFGKAIIGATRDVTCAYVFDFAAYLALGAAGAVALERTIAFASGRVTILHAPFASPDYALAASENAFAVDAVTLTDAQYLDAYTADPARGAFIVRQGEAPVIVPLAGNAGVYWLDAALMTMVAPDGRAVRILVAGERVLYAGRGDDFGERARAALEAMR